MQKEKNKDKISVEKFLTTIYQIYINCRLET